MPFARTVLTTVPFKELSLTALPFARTVPFKDSPIRALATSSVVPPPWFGPPSRPFRYLNDDLSVTRMPGPERKLLNECNSVDTTGAVGRRNMGVVYRCCLRVSPYWIIFYWGV